MSQKGVKMYFLGIIQVLGINFALKIIFWINFSVLLRSGLRALITDNSGLNKQMFPRLRTYPRRTAGWLGKTPGSHLESARSEGVSYYLGRQIANPRFRLEVLTSETVCSDCRPINDQRLGFKTLGLILARSIQIERRKSTTPNRYCPFNPSRKSSIRDRKPPTHPSNLNHTRPDQRPSHRRPHDTPPRWQ